MNIIFNREQKLKGHLRNDFDADYAFLEKALERSGDMVKNIFYTGDGKTRAVVIYVDGMSDAQTVQDFVIRPLQKTDLISVMKAGRKSATESNKKSMEEADQKSATKSDRKSIVEEDEKSATETDLLSFVENHVLETVDWKSVETYEDILTDILAGNAVLLIEGCAQAISLSTKKFPDRGVGETEQEMVIRGPKDSFTENFRTNTALIRRRIRDPRLKMEHTMVGERSKTDLAICYMDDLVEPALLREVKKCVSEISLDGILDGGMLEQLIEQNPWTPFPQMQHTERPDKAASGLLEGRVVLVIDNSPGVLILPVTYSMFFQSGDDYYTRFEVASFARLLRFVASLFAFGFPGLYVAIAGYHTEMLPTTFLLSIAQARTGIVIPVVLEVLLMEFQFELLREAGIHIPGQLGSTIGIVGGLIVGQAAVDAGLVSTIVVIVVAFTAIASFIVPSESFGEVFRLLKFLFIFAAAIWGIYGYLLLFAAVLFHLSQLESFGVPYLLPSVCGGDLDYNAKKDEYIRYPLHLMWKRPQFTKWGRRIRKRMGNENHERGNLH